MHKLAQWRRIMNQLTDTEYTAYVGIDWAAAKHDICVQAADDGRREFASGRGRVKTRSKIAIVG